MGELNKNEIEEAKYTFNKYNNEDLSSLTVTLCRIGLDCIDTIEFLKKSEAFYKNCAEKGYNVQRT